MKTLSPKLMRTLRIALALAPALALPVLAAPESFDFKDPKNGNKIEFKLDAPMEKIAGAANDISGVVTFDPQDPGATRGKIAVATASLTVPNAMQTSIMRGSQWLDAGQFPQITFEAKQLKNVKTHGDNTTADVVGTFTLHGVSKELTIPVEMKYLKDKLAERLGGSQKGDLLVITSTNFSIQRADFNIMPGKNLDKVADTIQLTLGVAGASPK
jgi:polyisoprenoid-binding protein YceI